MIRINLLPEAKRQASSGANAQLWGVAYLLSCFAWAIVLTLVWMRYSGALAEWTAKNEELQGQIDKAKAQTENIGEVEAKLSKSRQLEEVVGGLQAARQGPARVLMELSKILSDGGGPTLPPEDLNAMRRDNPLTVYNPGWDVRRLWLNTFAEENRKCSISGMGKSNEDVAELLRRLNVSEVFNKITLRSTVAASDKESGLSMVSFSLTCEVKY